MKNLALFISLCTFSSCMVAPFTYAATSTQPIYNEQSPFSSQQLYKYMDNLCALKIVKAMVLDSELQTVTSSIYPMLSSDDEYESQQKAKLKHLYYVPYSQVDALNGTSIRHLIDKTYGPLNKISSVHISNKMADRLVEQTSNYEAQALLTLTIGNAAVRTAFSPNHGSHYNDQSELFNFSGDQNFILNSQDQRNLALLIFSIANSKQQYEKFQKLIAQKNIEAIGKAFSKVKLDNNEYLSIYASNILADITSERNLSKLVTFVGTNMYKPSW